jgi:M6 family metalloprotease-like protein
LQQVLILKTGAAQALIGAWLIIAACDASAGIVSPRGGGPLPEPYRELKGKGKGAFTLSHAWTERRANQIRGDRRYLPALSVASTVLRDPQRALSGTLRIPVVLGLYSDITQSPFTNSAIDTELFTGPWTPGTLSEYWQEASYNRFNITGNVFDWVPLSQTEDYYTGGAGGWGLVPGLSKTGDMIKEIADALDPSVDFGAFDNDGPDGVANSGDDDGFVDVLLVMHPTAGAECDGAAHMWSHSWSYRSWPESGGEPYSTNDPSAGGGFVKIDDYIIVPTYSCGTGMIEIGVICHELGHAIGLPDLYDSNGNSSGIGYWGLMGAGNWNTPSSPAHPCVWSREQLGWVNPVEIDWRERSLTLDPVETSGDAVRLPLPARRFRRAFAPNGYALVCGYDDAEADVRDWPNFGGYGNGWSESMYHEFSVDAGRPVTLRFDVSFDVETDYDFGRVLLERGGTVDTLAVYNGRSSIRDTIDIGAHLPPGPCEFRLTFEFTSDVSFSDEDGYYDSRTGYSFNIDDVHVEGGGLDYFADFELDSGAWRNGSPPAEYFIVENRRRVGFDVNLKGQGMVVWHAENSIAYSELGNSGGARNTEARGVVLEEADGQHNLLVPTSAGGNQGDSGDPYPGSANNRSFGSTTIPRSQTNSGAPTPVSITGISSGTSAVSATFRGGMPPPGIEEVVPDTINKGHDTQAVLDVRGTWMQYGARAYLSMNGDTVGEYSNEWHGEERIVAAFPIDRLYAGEWDLSVASGDGQVSTAQGAVTVVSLFTSARVTAGRDYLLTEWTIEGAPGIRGCLLYRAVKGELLQPVTPDTLRGAAGVYSFRDYSVVPEILYSYRIIAYLNGGTQEVHKLTGPYRIDRVPFLADQNFPNPFTGETTVSFFTPSVQTVSVDVYDVSGRLVDHLGNRVYARGTHTLHWSPSERGTAAGVYFCVFRSGNASKMVKMIYVP